MRKIFLILLFLFFIPLVHGGTITIWEDNFDYSDAFTNHDYSIVDTCTGSSGSDTPINSFYTTNAVGFNLSTSESCTSQIITQFINPTTAIGEGIAYLNFDTAIINTSDLVGGSELFTVSIRPITDPGSRKLDFIMAEYNSSDKSFRYKTSCSADGCDTCNFDSVIGLNLTIIPIVLHHTIIFDFSGPSNSFTYSWIINNTISNCNNIRLGNITSARDIIINRNLVNGENYSYFIDNMNLQLNNISSGNFTSLPNNLPCLDNSECASGKCVNGYCQGKLGKEECNSDSECLSDNCINNLCAKPNFWTLVDASKTEIVGDDENTNNFVSLIFMIGLPMMFVIFGGIAGIVIGVMALYVIGFFFAIVGWLSPFILIGFIVAGLVAFVIFIMFIKGE